MRFESEDGALRVSTERDGLVTVFAEGTITKREITSALGTAWLLRRHKRQEDAYRALVIDLRGLTYTAAQHQFYNGEARDTTGIPGAILEMPAAFILPPGWMNDALVYCMRSAMEGAVLGAFTVPAEGRDWVLSRATVLAEQRERNRMTGLVTLSRMRAAASMGRQSDQGFAQDQAP